MKIKLPALATLNLDLEGKMTRWKKGEIVRVTDKIGRNSYCIEKLKRKPSGILKEGLPLFNMLAGVPSRAFTFHP